MNTISAKTSLAFEFNKYLKSHSRQTRKVPAFFFALLLVNPVLDVPFQSSTHFRQQVRWIGNLVDGLELLETIDKVNPALELGRHKDADKLEESNKYQWCLANVNTLDLNGKDTDKSLKESLCDFQSDVLALVEAPKVVDDGDSVLLCLGSLNELIDSVIQHSDHPVNGSTIRHVIVSETTNYQWTAGLCGEAGRGDNDLTCDKTFQLGVFSKSEGFVKDAHLRVFPFEHVAIALGRPFDVGFPIEERQELLVAGSFAYFSEFGSEIVKKRFGGWIAHGCNNYVVLF